MAVVEDSSVFLNGTVLPDEQKTIPFKFDDEECLKLGLMLKSIKAQEYEGEAYHESNPYDLFLLQINHDEIVLSLEFWDMLGSTLFLYGAKLIARPPYYNKKLGNKICKAIRRNFKHWQEEELEVDHVEMRL